MLDTYAALRMEKWYTRTHHTHGMKYMVRDALTRNQLTTSTCQSTDPQNPPGPCIAIATRGENRMGEGRWAVGDWCFYRESSALCGFCSQGRQKELLKTPLVKYNHIQESV